MEVRAIAATDFDGTLYRSDFTVSPKSVETLNRLGMRNILRVIVTGRSFFSLSRAIDDDFPVDYYILSSGSGVYSKKLKQLIYRTHLPLEQARAIGSLLLSMDLDFMIHEVLPHNHLFSYRKSGKKNEDFLSRLEYYREHGREVKGITSLTDAVSQFLVIEPPGSSLYEKLKEMNLNCTVIRTTSPLDHQSSWIEIFPKGTDKGSTLKWLADKYNIEQNKVFSIGNDFNDLHMLRWAGNPFVVDNAVYPLKKEFTCVPSNDDEGFSHAVNLWMRRVGL